MPEAAQSRDLTVRLGFSTPYSWNPISWLIRRTTRSPASHCWFIYWSQDFGCEIVADAHETGFRTVPFDVFRRQNRIVKIVKPAVDLRPGFQRLVPTWLGRFDYDFAGLLTGGILTAVRRWTKRQVKNPLRSAGQVFCSEAVVRVLQAPEVDYPGAQGLDPESSTPADLMVMFDRQGL